MNLSRVFSFLIPQRRRRASKDLTDRSASALEQRTLLATLVGNNRVTYQDINGDNVTVTFSKPLLDSLNVDSVMQFNGAFGDSGPQSLLRIDLLAAILGEAVGTSITTVATRSATNGGDGFANIGEILSGGVDIGNVTVDGDLGKILAGDGNLATQGLGALKVHSMGRFGTTTGAADLNSTVRGRMASLTTKTDFVGARLSVEGTLGAVTIGGSMVGGFLSSFGDMGVVKINGDLIGKSIGGGSVYSNGKLAGITIGGSLIGGTELVSGRIQATLDMGPVVIGGDIIGGYAEGAGSIFAEKKIASISVGGSIRGGSGTRSGHIQCGDVSSITVRGSVLGGSGSISGGVSSSGKISTLAIHGSVRTPSIFSGHLIAGEFGTATINGDLVGSLHSTGKLTSLTIGGSVNWGVVSTVSDAGTIKVGRDLIGGNSPDRGAILIGGKLGTLNIGGSIIGGFANSSGRVFVSSDLGTVTIGGSIIGGNIFTNRTGQLAARQIKTMTMNGSLIATSGTGLYSGSIVADADIGSLTIKGSVRGTAGSRALIMAAGQLAPTSTVDLAIGKLTINGHVERASILAGFEDDGPITDRNADAQIGTVVVTGDWIASDMVAGGRRGVDGFFGSADDRKMSGAGIKDVATVISRINSVTIGGQVVGSIEDNNDRFGFVAELVGSFKVKGGTTTFPLMANAGNDNLFVGIGIGGFPPDTWLRELTI